MDGGMEDLRFLGFFGIFVEAYKLIASRRKIFSKISLSLILPLCLLNFIPEGSAVRKSIGSQIFSECVALLLSKVVYLVGVIVLSLFSTSAVVYTVVCAYAAKDASFRNVMKVLPKVVKRLMLTFLCSFAILVVYNFTFIFSTTVIIHFAGKNSIPTLIAIIILDLFYLVGLVCIMIALYLADVVSVLEDVCGFPALRKSKNLVKGKKWTIFLIFLVLLIPFLGIGLVFGIGQYMGLGGKLVSPVVILVLMTLTFLLALVVKTVAYFVCKSYHHESIDKLSLSDHLDVYSVKYLPLKQNDVQPGECNV